MRRPRPKWRTHFSGNGISRVPHLMHQPTGPGHTCTSTAENFRQLILESHLEFSSRNSGRPHSKLKKGPHRQKIRKTYFSVNLANSNGNVWNPVPALTIQCWESLQHSQVEVGIGNHSNPPQDPGAPADCAQQDPPPSPGAWPQPGSQKGGSHMP